MNEAVIGDAWTAMEDFLADRRRRIPYLQHEKAELDRRYEIRWEREAGIAEGLERGLKQGVEQGLAQGLKQGLEQGVTKGRAEGILDATKKIALNLLRAGTSSQQTAQIAELLVEDVLTLARAHDLLPS